MTYKRQVGEPPLYIRSIYFVERRIEEDPGDLRFERVIGGSGQVALDEKGWASRERPTEED